MYACMVCMYIHVCVWHIRSLHYYCYSNTRSRGSTDESLDEDEESLLEVEDVTAYLRFNKEVRCSDSFCLLIPLTCM